MIPNQHDVIRSIRFGANTIHYRLRFAARRDLVISVMPDLAVAVSAPSGARDADIEARLIAKAPWILRQQLKYRDLHPLPVPRRFVAGESHRYLGRQYRLRVVSGGADGVRMARPFLIVAVRERPTEATVRTLLQKWYRSRAEHVLPVRLQASMERHPVLRIPDLRMRIRSMRTRWGSCSPSGLLSLNPELIRAPTTCIDYVLVHELCHRRVMNHGREFHRLLARVMPDWRERQARLNRLNG